MMDWSELPRQHAGVAPYTLWDAAKDEWPSLVLSGAVVVVALWAFIEWGRAL